MKTIHVVVAVIIRSSPDGSRQVFVHPVRLRENLLER